MKVLALDTSTEACSAAVLLDDGRAVSRFMLTERSHAELILPMVDDVLRESGLTLTELDGIAFGRGPGGFTGVRIAAGVTQGLAFGAGLKVAPVSSLAAVAAQLLLSSPDAVGALKILVCNDARMHEVYWAAYDVDAANRAELKPLTGERVSLPDAVVVPEGITDAAGNGLGRYPLLRQRFEQAGLRIHEGIYPHATAIAQLGAEVLRRGEGVDAAEALPTYVRDDVARPSGGIVTTMS